MYYEEDFMKYSLIRSFSSADGRGLRTSVYFSGCQKALEGNACPGCHNATAWDKEVGQDWTKEVQDIVLKSLEPDYVAGLSVLGGEPFSDFNLEAVLELVTAAKEAFPKKDVWVWTGYTVEELIANANKKDLVFKIFEKIDYLIDGPFLQDLKNPNLKFRGSANQRILKINHENTTQLYEDVTDLIESL